MKPLHGDDRANAAIALVLVVVLVAAAVGVFLFSWAFSPGPTCRIEGTASPAGITLVEVRRNVYRDGNLAGAETIASSYSSPLDGGYRIAFACGSYTWARASVPTGGYEPAVRQGLPCDSSCAVVINWSLTATPV